MKKTAEEILKQKFTEGSSYTKFGKHRFTVLKMDGEGYKRIIAAMEAYASETLRDELIRFQVFLSNGIQTGSIMGYSTTQVVNAYLKQRNP